MVRIGVIEVVGEADRPEAAGVPPLHFTEAGGCDADA